MLHFYVLKDLKSYFHFLSSKREIITEDSNFIKTTQKKNLRQFNDYPGLMITGILESQKQYLCSYSTY